MSDFWFLFTLVTVAIWGYFVGNAFGSFFKYLRNR